MFDHILQQVESNVLKLGIGYPSFIFGILRDQHASIPSHTENFSGPPFEIRLNPKLFQGLHKVNAPPGKSFDRQASVSFTLEALKTVDPIGVSTAPPPQAD